MTGACQSGRPQPVGQLRDRTERCGKFEDLRPRKANKINSHGTPSGPTKMLYIKAYSSVLIGEFIYLSQAHGGCHQDAAARLVNALFARACVAVPCGALFCRLACGIDSDFNAGRVACRIAETSCLARRQGRCEGVRLLPCERLAALRGRLASLPSDDALPGGAGSCSFRRSGAGAHMAPVAWLRPANLAFRDRRRAVLGDGLRVRFGSHGRRARARPYRCQARH